MTQGQLLLQLKIRRSRLRVAAQVVAKEQVTTPEPATANNRMEVVRARSCAGLSQVAPLRDLRLVLPDMLVSVALELGNAGLDLR